MAAVVVLVTHVALLVLLILVAVPFVGVPRVILKAEPGGKGARGDAKVAHKASDARAQLRRVACEVSVVCELEVALYAVRVKVLCGEHGQHSLAVRAEEGTERVHQAVRACARLCAAADRNRKLARPAQRRAAQFRALRHLRRRRRKRRVSA